MFSRILLDVSAALRTVRRQETFDGTSIVKVELTVNGVTQSCTFDLATRTSTCKRGEPARGYSFLRANVKTAGSPLPELVHVSL